MKIRKISNFLKNSKIFENLIFRFSKEFFKIFKIFKIFEKFRPQKIFWTLCCNFTSNKQILDFLDIFRCRFVTRRRWNRLKRANLQSEAAHKKKNSGVIFSGFRIRNSCSRLLPDAHRCTVLLENH